jgi:hypothetical protein
MSKVYDWFNDRLEVGALAEDVTSKYVPPHVNDSVCDRFRDDFLLQAISYRSI